jgi:hypothetical protein
VGSIRGLLRTGRGENSGHEDSRPQSQRSDGLIQEFESSGKGWFWETTREGMLSYISDSVAEALGRNSEDLLDRPFTDLISTDTTEGSATSERTLGFYLSSHVAFQDLILRAKTKNETWWSISGRPVHDEIGRFFGFRGFGGNEVGEWPIDQILGIAPEGLRDAVTDVGKHAVAGGLPEPAFATAFEFLDEPIRSLGLRPRVLVRGILSAPRPQQTSNASHFLLPRGAALGDYGLNSVRFRLRPSLKKLRHGPCVM